MLRFLPLAVFVVLVAFFLAGLELDSRLVPSPLLNKPAPAFHLSALDADTPPVDSEKLQGQVWLLNVWASWCVACRAEHAFIQRLAGEGAYIVGLNYKDENAAAKEWLQTWQNPYQQIAVDRSGEVGLDWGVYGVPETFVIDAAGVIRYKHVGPINEEDLQQTIRPLLVKLRAELDA
ncbi:MAG: DsbE family thiol:disulfide interchange protein [Proteobacteria bacterium]|nr:DsbE family thiol:disulfide interchange protein [Pseudomonadota bacterium]